MDKPLPFILLVDDDPDDRENIREALHLAGSDHEIKEAHDGEEALERLEEMKANGDLPGLMVLDINMPKVNGKELVVAVQADETLSTIPLVVLSTSTSALDKLFFAKKGVEMVEKPFEMTTFATVATKLLSHWK